MQQLDNKTASFGLAASIVILLNSIIVILKESSHSFHQALASITGNHWASQGVVDIALFFVFGFVFSKLNLKANKTILLGSVVLSVAIILEYFG